VDHAIIAVRPFIIYIMAPTYLRISWLAELQALNYLQGAPSHQTHPENKGRNPVRGSIWSSGLLSSWSSGRPYWCM
jgi:hypothetical protein